MKIFTLTIALGVIAAAALAMAGDVVKSPAACTEVQTVGCATQCGHCGRSCQCNKNCRIVCEMKEVKKTVWVVNCKQVCTMMPGCGKCGCNCNSCADETCTAEACGCEKCCGKHCDPCAAEKAKHYVTPKCGKVRTCKTLEKKEVVCKVPSYKCVVDYACPECCSEGKPAAAK